MTIAINSGLAMPIRSRRFIEGGRQHWNVRIFLSADSDNELDRIDHVQYELHPTFKQRHRESTDRKKGFEIIIWTYGFFNIKATLFFNDKTVDTITGFVRWRTPSATS